MTDSSSTNELLLYAVGNGFSVSARKQSSFRLPIPKKIKLKVQKNWGWHL